MSVENPRWYKWYPTEETDLGTQPFEGDWTKDDMIYTQTSADVYIYYYCHTDKYEFGRTVTKKVGQRTKHVWEPGVTITPVYKEVDGQQVQMPVWFKYCGVGVCCVKVPEGSVVEEVNN